MKISELAPGMSLQIPKGDTVDYSEVVEAVNGPKDMKHFLLRNLEGHTLQMIGHNNVEVQYKVVEPLPEGVAGPNLPF